AFGLKAQQERQELYIRIAEWVWNPSRLSLGEPEPPVHEPIGGATEEGKRKPRRGEGEEPARFAVRRAFWTALLEHVRNRRTEFHANCNPTSDAWIAGGSGRTGLSFVYVVLQDSTRM